jgi:5-methylcytosine-specific restriction protein A
LWGNRCIVYYRNVPLHAIQMIRKDILAIAFLTLLWLILPIWAFLDREVDKSGADRAISSQPKEHLRSSKWDNVRKSHLKEESCCAVCGTEKDLEIHHILAFEYYPELELEDSNLITLCRHDHFVWGHLCDWKSYNPKIREQIETYKGRVKNRPFGKVTMTERVFICT